MTTGSQDTKYHIAAKGLPRGNAVGAFSAAGLGLVDSPDQANVFNINGPNSQNSANLLALANEGTNLSFSTGSGVAIAQQAYEKEKKEREERTYRDLIDGLQRQIDGWRAEQGRNSEEIERNKTGLNAITRLKELTESGELEKNPAEKRRLLELAGIDPELEGEDLANAIRNRERRLSSRNQFLEKRNQELQGKIDHNEILIQDIKSGRALETEGGYYTNPTMRSAQEAAQQKLGEIFDPSMGLTEKQSLEMNVQVLEQSFGERRASRAFSAVTQTAVPDVVEHEAKVSSGVFNGDQLSDFIEELENTKSIGDKTQRLSAQKSLYERLTEDAKADLPLMYDDNEIVKAITQNPDYFNSQSIQSTSSQTVPVSNSFT